MAVDCNAPPVMTRMKSRVYALRHRTMISTRHAPATPCRARLNAVFSSPAWPHNVMLINGAGKPVLQPRSAWKSIPRFGARLYWRGGRAAIANRPAPHLPMRGRTFVFAAAGGMSSGFAKVLRHRVQPAA